MSAMAPACIGDNVSGDVISTSASLSRTAAALCSTPPYAREMVAGGVAGVVSKTVVAPLERVKLMRQGGAAPRGASAVQMLLDIRRGQGLAGIFRGNGANALRVFPSKALHFMTYERYRSLLAGAAPSFIGDGPVVDLLAGSAAGGTTLLATYPLDLARTRLACCAPGDAGGGSGMSGVIRGAYAEGGVRGVYRGLCPSLARVLPTAGLRFYVYEALKARLPEEQEGRTAAKVACGVAAGLAANTATYPVDVVRRQIQLGGTGGIVQGLRDMVRKQGARLLYAGLGLTYVKAVPSVAVALVAYDYLRVLLMLPARDHKATGKK